MLRGGDKYERPIWVLLDVEEGRRVAGQINLSRGNRLGSTVVSFVDDKPFIIADGGSLHGRCEVGRVSLLKCVGSNMLSTSTQGGFAIHHGDVAFHYALFGGRHLSADDREIRGIQFTLEGAESSVFANDKFDSFGLLDNPDEAVVDAIERTMPEYMRKRSFVRGKAMVSFFKGHGDFVGPFETVIGTVHVWRTMKVDRFGRSMKDAARISINFDHKPTTLDEAWGKMRDVRQFFAWMMGYAPAWRDVLVFTSEQDEASELAVFAPNEWAEAPGDAKEHGALIDASRNPDHFATVMQKWLERNGDPRRRSANTRFFSCLRGVSRRAIEDGIVSAGNTFDLLPDDDKPNGGNSRKRPALRKTIEHRAKEVLDHFGEDKLTRLDEAIGLAVKCRNHYTHGPKKSKLANVDFDDPEVVIFLTELLEFLYLASELLACGWDSSTSEIDDRHPIGEFINHYDSKRSHAFGPK